MTLVAALGCGLVAGVFFTFSSFVMTALARLSPAEGIRAMQSINVEALRSWFLAAFLGTTALCAVLAVMSLWSLSRPSSVLVLIGAALYVVGSFLVTMVFNVPMNNSLAALTSTAPDVPAQWTAYLTKWTAWNHVRTLACLAAATLLTISLVLRN